MIENFKFIFSRYKHIDTITKVNYILTNHLIDYLNASIEYSIVSTWGYLDNATNTWSGMIGQLVTKKADLGASPLFFTEDRIPIIQYLAMTSPTRSKFIFKSPKLSFTDNVFLLPFENVSICNMCSRFFNFFLLPIKSVWICLGATIIVTSTALFLVSYIEWRITQNMVNRNGNIGNFLRIPFSPFYRIITIRHSFCLTFTRHSFWYFVQPVNKEHHRCLAIFPAELLHS